MTRGVETGVPQFWRLRDQNYRLVGEVHRECGAKIFPPRDVCPRCRDKGPLGEFSKFVDEGGDGIDFFDEQGREREVVFDASLAKTKADDNGRGS